QVPNIFNTIPAYTPQPEVHIMDKLAAYLSTPTKQVDNVFQWWTLKKAIWPNLARMVLDYLSMPAQTTHALMCLGAWSLLGMVHTEDIKSVARLPEVVEVEGDQDDWEGYVDGA
ncbi:hypothetical protein DXG01_014162, partial [Tephrocybe rancida]